MICNVDGCSGEVAVEDVGRICTVCGSIQDTNAESLNNRLVNYTNTVSRDAYVRHHITTSTRSYNMFTKTYFSLTLKLGTSFVLSEQGQQMLPKLWDNIQLLKNKRKKEMLAALLFLLYNQHKSSFGIKQFQKKVCLNFSKFTSCVEYVRKLFNFPPSVGTIENTIFDCISELSKLVLNDSNTETQKGICKLGQRLAKIAHAKNWLSNTNKSYVEQVSCASTVIAAHFFSSERIDRKSKSGKRSHFRYSGINVEKLAKFVEISKRRVFIWIRTLQEALFTLMQEMPVTPGCVTDHKDVGMVLVAILDYVDLNIDDCYLEDEEEDLVDEKFLDTKNIFTKALYDFLTSKETERKFNMPDFAIFVQQQFNDDDDCLVSLSDNALQIGKYEFHIHHIDLLKDLITSGCSLEELFEGKHSQLIKTYLEQKLSEDESDLDELDDEIEDYIRSPKEIEELKKQFYKTN